MPFLILLTLLLSGCANIAWEIQPPNPAVKPVLKGRDCVETYFNIGFGNATFANAMRRGIPATESFDPFNDATRYTQIRTIHSASINAAQALVLGIYCLDVTGEP